MRRKISQHPGFKQMVSTGKQHPGFNPVAKQQAKQAGLPQPSAGVPSQANPATSRIPQPPACEEA